MINSLFLFITGLTIFLFGMIKLSTLMRGLFSGRIRGYIRMSVRRPIYGLFLGIVSTILFQSSLATTLVTVGIVSAGLVSFYHSLGIILGADIGTTLTAQLVVWKVTSISPLIIFAGGFLFFAGKEQWKTIGEAVFYFGIIFFGLSLISDATSPLKENEAFLHFFRNTKNPFIGLAIGLIFTAIVHSSAIPVSTLIILGQQGLISIENALPIVLGANIGTTVTAIMEATVTNVNGKRTAIAHLMFKVFGVVLCLALFPFFVLSVKKMSGSVAQQIAYSHFLLNLTIAMIFIFILKPFSRLLEAIIPGTDQVLPLWPEFLDEKCLVSPEEALVCVNKELGREIALTQKMLITSISLIDKFKPAKQRDLAYIELVVNNVQTEITQYLWNLSCNHLTPALSKRLFAFSSLVYDIERIGDRSTNIAELAESRHKRKAQFSEPAKKELDEISKLVVRNLDDAAMLIEQRDTKRIQDVFERHLEVLLAIKAATQKHLERFYQKVCLAEAGPIFVDVLVNLERISDHCQVIAEHISNVDE
ncbi:MAG TPA: Na/Pi cotransporter family protein [Syntrophorhabdus sp.]|jgi:phosphate:Na+ symporter|nr:MAG: Na+/Pi-cotransporter [Syntrophorhabdus sp. PtaB.Bin027]OQB76080.1 MAG: Na+/Pi-cotransporter [Deltaproteobacteria bacterium ADurb.Bin135]HNS77301.1 Na/Pi cotransporter family protein [Syntrophorhabdus sp.]HNY70224.1 Na/Pi cotransporter family protein [Syntrophorhabdus sp.]HOH25809.1 Na/Pi cotransporter family protein [Syntrophorhabdus sp.]